MNISFELLSSMSPKVNKHRKPVTKGPTKLALKNYFRKSLVLSNANTSLKGESIIIVDSDSLCSSSEESKRHKGSPIVISDSETSQEKTPLKKDAVLISDKDTPQKETSIRLSKNKYVDIQHWVDDVNNAAEKDVTVFTELSTILNDENLGFKNPKTNIALSSTVFESDAKRFDQIFKKCAKKVTQNDVKSPVASLKGNNDLLINDSLISEDLDNVPNISTDDSFELPATQSLAVQLQKKLEQKSPKILSDDSFELPGTQSLAVRLQKKLDQKSPEPAADLSDSLEYENLLDSLYGNSWRAKKDDVLPSSEPRVKTTKTNIARNIPNTERCANKTSLIHKGDNKSNNLLQVLQKNRLKNAIQSPWTRKLQNVCDSDTDSEDRERSQILSPVRLNFDEQNEEKENEVKSPYFSKKGKSKKFLVKKNGEATTYSFLASLSANVPVEKCDITALIFRNSFQNNRQALAAKLFELYNEKVFENKIPKDTQLDWSDRLRGTAGLCSCKKITRRTGAVERTVRISLSTKVLDSADRLRDTLIHEMCHAATWIVNQVSDGHGSFWKAWACRAMQTFPELPPIKRCHSYVINTKYTYKCTGCGYSIGRHTKSLDTQRKRCGYCYGTFEVLINKTSKKGEIKSVPATPKKPSGFALFVKENYANFKSPDLKHGDVMKILGQKFTDLKINKT